MDGPVKKLLRSVLLINLIALAVGTAVFLFIDLLWGMIAFGASLLPAALVVKHLEATEDKVLS